MTTLIAELHDALISAGALEDKARKAAETVAADDNKFIGIDLTPTKIEGDLTVVQWMLGLWLAGFVSIVIKSFVG